MKRHRQELDIDEDIVFEQKTWTVQRIGWVIMILIVLLALLGFTGRGGLFGINKRIVQDNSQELQLEYEPFVRRGAGAEIRVELKAADTAQTRLNFSQSLLEKVRIEQVVPQPSQAQIDENGITYTFSGGERPAQYIFYLSPQKAGKLHTSLRAGRREISFSQFIYP
jgi:hypothetical protein